MLKDLQIASVGNSLVDFSKLDLSPWKIQGGKLLDPKTRERLNEEYSLIGDLAWNRIVDATQRGNGSGMYVDYEHRSLLWPLDKTDVPEISDYYEVINIIRVLHPSEIYIQNIFDGYHSEGFGTQITSWTHSESYINNKYDNPDKHFFDYPEDELGETNKLLAFIKQKVRAEYIKNAIKYYSDSFMVNSSEMSFICLCICLETIVHGREQLSYKFRRNLAVLCSNNEEEGNKIYDNAKLLYIYRSQLVHSGMNRKSYEKFDLYFKYAQFLSAKMIIEMMLHSVENIKELNDRITKIGFGSKEDISDGYEEIISNRITWNEVSKYEL